MHAIVWVRRGREMVQGGTLTLTGDAITTAPDEPWLTRLASKQVGVLTPTGLLWVDPNDDPVKFLKALERTYSGQAMRVEVVEEGDFKESMPADVEVAGFQEYKDDQPRNPKGSDEGGQWAGGSGGGGGGGKGGGKRLDASDFDNSDETFEVTMRRKLKGVEVQTEKIDKLNPAVAYVVLPSPMIAYHASTSNLSKSGLTPKSNDLTKRSTNLGGADNASYYAEYKLNSDEDTDPDTGEPIGQPDAIYVHAVLLPAGTKVYDPEASSKVGGVVGTVGEPGQLRIFDKIPAKNVLGVMKVTAGDKIPNQKAIRTWASKLKVK